MPHTTDISGGVTMSGGTVIGDVVGRDKIMQAPDPLAQYFHQLPPAPIDFVGREDEQRDLLNMIERGAVITGLRGMGGVGKTALGLVVAHQLIDRYPDAQFFLDLRGAGDNPVTPLDALTHVVRAFHPTSKLPDHLEDMQALYRTVLQDKRTLVFFDNARDAPQVMPLLPPASCLLLITSRAHFTLPGMKARDLNVLPPDKARELLISIAERLAGVILSREAAKDLIGQSEIATPPAAARNDGIPAADLITKLCGYLPQALRASACLLADEIDLDPREYVRQLRDERQRLQRIGLDPARNLDMEATLNLSYAALTADEQRVFARLSVFPADFDAEAEEAICEDHDHAHLSRLVKLSLVQFVTPTPALPRSQTATNRGGAGGGGRYSLHDLVRLFAAARLSDTERNATQYQHAKHYLNVMWETDRLYKQGGESITQGLALFDREWSNIQAGQLWATAHAEDDDEAAQLCNNYPNAGAYVLNLRLHPRDRIRWLQDAVRAAQHLQNRKMEGVHLGNLGIAYAALGETRQAIEFYEQALSIARDIGDKRNEGARLGSLGLAYADLGETRQAIEFYEQALSIARDIGDKRNEGAWLGNLGLAYAALGETRQAIEFYEQALIIMREIGDRRAEGSIVGNLGLAYAALGETRKAIEFYEQALSISRAIGDRRGEGADLGNLGSAYYSLGETRQAIEFYEQALVIDREIGDRRGEGTDLGNLGLAYAALGETRRAIEFYEQALSIMREIGDRRAEGSIVGNLGLAYAALGETRKAIEFYEQALIIRRAIGDKRGEGNDLWNMALALDKLGERQQAIAHAEAALKIRKAIEDPRAEKVRRKLAEWRA